MTGPFTPKPAGTADDYRLFVANGSGEVLPVNFDDNACLQYGEVTKPGSGSTIAALAADEDACYAADTSGNVFERNGENWRRIGIENAQVNFFDLCVAGESLLVAGGGGTCYRYDRTCENWTPVSVGETAIHAVAHANTGDDERAVAVGASGTVHEWGSGRGWRVLDAPVESDLLGVALGETDVTVGAGGAILER